VKPKDEKISIREIAKRYGIAESETLGAMKAGKLKGYFNRPNAEWLVKEEDFKRWKLARSIDTVAG
jgi:hypothetical protein